MTTFSELDPRELALAQVAISRLPAALWLMANSSRPRLAPAPRNSPARTQPPWIAA